MTWGGGEGKSKADEEESCLPSLRIPRVACGPVTFSRQISHITQRLVIVILGRRMLAKVMTAKVGSALFKRGSHSFDLESQAGKCIGGRNGKKVILNLTGVSVEKWL